MPLLADAYFWRAFCGDHWHNISIEHTIASRIRCTGRFPRRVQLLKVASEAFKSDVLPSVIQAPAKDSRCIRTSLHTAIIFLFVHAAKAKHTNQNHGSLEKTHMLQVHMEKLHSKIFISKNIVDLLCSTSVNALQSKEHFFLCSGERH